MTQPNKPSDNRPLNEADKDLLLSKMLETPGELSDSEISLILEDDELRDIYTLSVDLKAGKKSHKPLDAKQEWGLFQPLMDKSDKTVKTNRAFELEQLEQSSPSEPTEPTESSETNEKSSSPRRWFNILTAKRLTRVAAIFVGALLIVGAIQMVNNNPQTTGGDLLAEVKETEPESETPTLMSSENQEENSTIPNSSESNRGGKEIDVEELVKENAPVKHTQQKTVSPIKKNKTKISNTSVQHLAQNKQDINVEEYLRVQQARMDNDMAMQRAQAVMNQYYSMAEINGDDPSVIEANLNYGDAYSMEDELIALMLP